MLDPKEISELIDSNGGKDKGISERKEIEKEIIADFNAREKNIVSNIKADYFILDSIFRDSTFLDEERKRFIEVMSGPGLLFLDVKYDLKVSIDSDSGVKGPLYTVSVVYTLDPYTKKSNEYAFYKIILPYDTELLGDIYKSTLEDKIDIYENFQYIKRKKIIHEDTYIDEQTGFKTMYLHLVNEYSTSKKIVSPHGFLEV